ncbi:hypothetical protein Tco_1044732 [Tanacetum coccineum]|uniref:Reverse transcriptase Ty1/copia-type domain-containing protein n=1 Tax=Tanacetum coccineum TaxID=301880 RepID=A0ABQ5GSY3_9ASTR
MYVPIVRPMIDSKSKARLQRDRLIDSKEKTSNEDIKWSKKVKMVESRSGSECVIIAVYVDDFNIIGTPGELLKAIECLKREFEMKDLGKT